MFASGARKTYHTEAGPVPAVRNLTLTVGWGEFVAIMGPSGSGKSTALGLLAGLTDPDEGSPAVEMDGVEWRGLSSRDRALRRREMCALVHQGINLVDFLTVTENVALPLLMNGMRRGYAVRRASEALTALGLQGMGDRLPAQISGGQQQRVALARAAASSQRIILADEPTGALDSELAHQVLRSMADHVAAGGAAVVVTHNDLVCDFAHRVVTIKDGVLHW